MMVENNHHYELRENDKYYAPRMNFAMELVTKQILAGLISKSVPTKD